MKVTVNAVGVIPAAPFPKLMIVADGLIILAVKGNEAHITGMVLVEDDAYFVGHYSQTWAASSFVDYHGTITLEA